MTLISQLTFNFFFYFFKDKNKNTYILRLITNHNETDAVLPATVFFLHVLIHIRDKVKIKNSLR